MSTAALVPARSGSKRLPGKNIMELGGRPLVAWTLEAVIESDSIDEVIFSTDSLEYWDIATGLFKSEKLVLDLRTPDAAGDKVKIFDYLTGHGSRLFDRHDDFVLALPTCPFRESRHIEEAVKIYRTYHRPVFSASAFEFPTSFAFELDGIDWKTGTELNPMLTGETRSQEQEVTYHPNGAIYVRATSSLSDPDLISLYTNAVPYIMERQDSIDIDDASDFEMAEAIIQLRSTASGL